MRRCYERAASWGILIGTVVAATIVLVPAIGRAQAGGRADLFVVLPAPWTGLQGGPEHLGSSEASVAPALRAMWRRRAPGKDGRLSMPVVDGTTIVAVGLDEVVAVDATAGQVQWSVPRARAAIVPPALDTATGQDRVVYVEGTGRGSAVVAVDASTGRRAWRTPLKDSALGAPSVSGGLVAVGDQSGAVTALEGPTGAQRWRFRTAGAADASPAIADGRVFAVSEDAASGKARLYAIDASSGRQAWAYSPPGFSNHTSSPTVSGGSVFVGFGDLTVRSFAPARGRVRWTAFVRGDFSPQSSAAVRAGRVFLSDREGGVYSFDRETGARLWDFQFEALATRGAPMVVGSVLYQGLDDGTLAAIEVGSGHLVWSADLGADPIGPLAPARGLVLAPALGAGGGLVAFGHDPNAALVDVRSPTELDAGRALLNLLGAATVIMVVIVGLFRLLARRRPRVDGPVRSPAEPRGDQR